jgi:HSP20 family molecular chaperone IbpA
MNQSEKQRDTTTSARARMPERTRERPAVAPAVDIYENQEEILLVADLPGVQRDHVSIDLEKDQLTLQARRSWDGAPEGFAARFHGFDYYRTFLVPKGIDAEKISAELTNGVLRVHLPKSAAVKPRRIEVRAG